MLLSKTKHLDVGGEIVCMICPSKGGAFLYHFTGLGVNLKTASVSASTRIKNQIYLKVRSI